ncbi:MAG TPA: hypothetical protein VKU41_21780, partial [Polyangiaceae bacterium]|nr:hypothetical protein [Polyangiaceae bacterium]
MRSPPSHAIVALCIVVGAQNACGSSGSDKSGSRFQPGPADASVAPPSDGSVPAMFGDDGGNTTFGQGAAQSLVFEPNAATVVVDGTGSQKAQFTLKAIDGNGNATMVLADSVDFDRPDLARVAAGEPVVATAPSAMSLYGGVGTIHALYQGLEAKATLTVQVRLTDYGPGLGPTSPAVMALGAGSLQSDPAAAIAPLLYPYDKTVWPLGLTSPLLMWNAPQAGDVYRLHYVEKNYSFDGYYTLGALPAQMRLDQGAWDRLTASNDAKNVPDPLSFALSRWDSQTGTAYATSSQTWTIAPESLRGAIYYWTASKNSQGIAKGHISRFQPGTGATPQPLNNGTCMGCHAVNALGTVLVADVDDQVQDGTAGATHTAPSVAPYDNWSGTRPFATFDITQAAAPLTYQSNKFGGNIALTPDGKYLVFGGPASPAGSKYLSLG